MSLDNSKRIKNVFGGSGWDRAGAGCPDAGAEGGQQDPEGGGGRCPPAERATGEGREGHNHLQEADGGHQS